MANGRLLLLFPNHFTEKLVDQRARPCVYSHMSNVPAELKYAKTHEWVRIAGGIATIGITDHAQHELTDIVFVELPKKGRTIKAGESCAVVESVKTASDIYSPVSGDVIEINQSVVDNPALVNTEPYAGGWFFQIRLRDPDEIKQLLSADDYKKQTHA